TLIGHSFFEKCRRRASYTKFLTGPGHYWDCAPSTGTPVSQIGQTTLTLNFSVLPGGDPLDNATVKACTTDDTECASPVVAPGTTDAQGNVTFVLPSIGVAGFGGYFDVSAPTIYPTLYFLQSSLSVPQVTFPGTL